MIVADIPKTSFKCHRGKFEFVHMPFCVRNATTVFQELMTKILAQYKGFASPCMDNVIIYSST